MAEPAARQHTAPANANDARPSSSLQPFTSSLRQQHGREHYPRQTDIVSRDKPKPKRKSSLKNAKNSTEALRTRLRQDAARRKSPPDGRPGGRAWAVGNIGHNGRLYLRPVVRPGNERSRPPAPPFTNAQPRRSLLIAENTRAAKALSTLGFEGHQSRSESPTTPPMAHRVHSSAVSDDSVDYSPPQAGSVQRSQSFSTVDTHIFARAEAPGTLRVVISRARSHRERRKGHDSEDTGRLGVPIPSHRIGEPQFGPRGTPILRSSSQATNGQQYPESVRSGHTSMMQAPHAAYVPAVSRRHSEMSHTPAFVFRPSASNSVIATANPQLAVYIRERDFWAHASAFDHLEAHPLDPSLIVYATFKAPKKRKIVYATPLTLVAQITSSTNVDYDLLSDFFMTFRQFMPKKTLLEFLHDRFLWAVARQGDVSTAVRVRTFVALRHWVLNYMAEDFVPDVSLRIEFCALLNGLYDYLRDIGATGPKGLEQIAELKRCWRQYIAQYFDDSYDEYASAHEPIYAGGQLDTTAYGRDVNAITFEPSGLEARKTTDHLRRTRSNPKLLERFQTVKHGQQPSGTTGVTGTGSSAITNTRSTQTQEPNLVTHNSHKSSVVWSCSIPLRPSHTLQLDDEIALNKQAVPRTVALPPHLDNPMRANRPKRVHQRNGSYADALSEAREHIELSPIEADEENTQLHVRAVTPSNTSLPGDLIRGRSLLPWAPDLEYQKDRPRLDIGEESDRTTRGPGVRRMIGSIRRAVSNSKQLQGPPLRHAHLERRGDQLSTVATPGHASAPSGGTSSLTSSRVPKSERVLGPLRPKTDLLGEKSLESFNKAVAAASVMIHDEVPTIREPLGDQEQMQSPLGYPHQHLQFDHASPHTRRGQSTANVTMGSRSIVIGHDDTQTPPSVVESDILMSGALQPPRIVRTDSDEATFDMAGFQAPLDDDEPVKAATDDGWQTEEPEWEMQQVASSPPMSSPIQSSDFKSSISGTYLAQEMQARLGHQPSKSLDDPVLPDDPQPSRSLRRRNDRGNLRAALPSFHERLAVAQGPLPDALHSHPPSRPSSHVSMLASEELPSLPSPGLLGPTVEEQLKSMLFPDDPNEDGSPQAALLKLEGRLPDVPRIRTSFDLDMPQDAQPDHGTQDKLRHRHEHVTDANAPIQEPRPSVIMSQASTAVSPVHPTHRHNVSEVSYNSIPLLERGLADRISPGHRSHLRIVDSDSSESIADYRFPGRTGQLRAVNPDKTSEEDDRAAIDSPESLRGLSLEDMIRQATPGAEESSSDVDESKYSPHRSRASLETERGVRNTYHEPAVERNNAATEALFHPLRHLSTPPPSVGADRNAYGVRINNGLPTPANSPPSRLPKTSLAAGVYIPTRAAVDDDDEEPEPQPRPQPAMAPPKHSAFILRVRAQRLAEAMTLVEQSALAQVNWRELIDLSWSKTGLERIRDWSDFVIADAANSPSGRRAKSDGPKSVDLVIARFNVVVKWAVSEIILTDDLLERVHCIQQYIRVAAACRGLRNFATMYQITTALVSADLAGLRETWDLVPTDDKAWLKEMETLVSPLKSFENVRKEQEVVVPGAGGCIPFIGVYLNDLALNATRVPTVENPSTSPKPGLQVQLRNEGKDDAEPMINFERYQNAAAIVKTVLRLIESSKQYHFEVNPKLVSRCLWVCALRDEEIRGRARAIGV